jgi:iron complex transport system substrate-binding protein
VLAQLRLAVTALAACGSDDGDDEAATGEGGGEAAEGGGDGAGAGGPIEIEHLYGSTTLDAPPERIVSLDTQWTDVLTALDAPLVAMALDPQLQERYPWQDVVADGVEDIQIVDSIPYETVAAARPDLIVVSWGATEEADYEKLSEIAPTIPLLGDREVDPWQDIARAAGELLGRPDDAEALIDEVDQATADVAAGLPGLEGKTYALANYVPGDAIHVVADPDDGAATFFAQLGLSIDPELLAAADGETGRMELSPERVDELDADLLVLLTNGAEPSEIPGYDQLPAVVSGAVAVLDVATITGLNTPTPLSIPYATEAVLPALEAAAAA